MNNASSFVSFGERKEGREKRRNCSEITELLCDTWSSFGETVRRSRAERRKKVEERVEEEDEGGSGGEISRCAYAGPFSGGLAHGNLVARRRSRRAEIEKDSFGRATATKSSGEIT